MDPLALAAVVGLVFAGQRFSDSESPAPPPTTVIMQAPPPPRQLTKFDTELAGDSHTHQADAYGLRPINPSFGRRIGDDYLPPKEAVSSLQDWSPMANRYPHGEPVYDLYNRENVTNKQNNLAPIERKNVGPGLGVAPNVPAIGGFQQFFRALPNNVNEEKLVTLPGEKGPASYFVKSGGTEFPTGSGLINGSMSHQAKTTKSWYRPPAQNSGQGQGIIRAPEGRPDNIKTRATTIRQETGPRFDTLGLGPGQYAQVYQPYSRGLTDTSLPHSTGNRVNPDRPGNGQRMNVRADPQGQVGAATQVREESIPLQPGPMNLYAAGGGGPYKAPENWSLNNAKSNKNPLASNQNLNLARDQITGNPLASPIWAAS